MTNTARRSCDHETMTTTQVSVEDRARWRAFMVLCLGSFMIVLDTTIVNVALPSIRTDLGFSEGSLAWVVNAYMLFFGGFLLLGGRRKCRRAPRWDSHERLQLACHLHGEHSRRRRRVYLGAAHRPVSASRRLRCAHRHRRRGHRDGVADACRLRDRERQRGGVD